MYSTSYSQSPCSARVKCNKPACWGWGRAEEAKGSSSLQQVFPLEPRQVLQNKGLKLKHGDSPPDPFPSLLWPVLYLSLSVLLNDAFLLTVQFPGQFCNCRIFCRLFLHVPNWEAKAESAQILVCLVLFTSWCALGGARGAPTCAVGPSASGSVPSATFPSATFCTPYVPSNMHTGVLNTLHSPSIFKFIWIDSYWQFFSTIDIATPFTRNGYWHDFGVVMTAQCYHSSTKF